jgi:hypothetical protein
MRTAHNGFWYDTEKSRRIISRSAGHKGSDSSWRASLYRTSAGRYFLYGAGGEMTIFKGKARIIPMGEDEAMAWQDGW